MEAIVHRVSSAYASAANSMTAWRGRVLRDLSLAARRNLCTLHGCHLAGQMASEMQISKFSREKLWASNCNMLVHCSVI